MRSDQGQIDAQKLNLTYCRIVSPVEGRVGLRQVDVGNYVTPSDTNGVAVVTQLDPISVLFTLPEDNLRQLMPRLRAGAELQVTAYDKTNTEKLAEGKLQTVDNRITSYNVCYTKLLRAPPLIITAEQLAEELAKVDEVLASVDQQIGC